jgi:peroxiredoxin
MSLTYSTALPLGTSAPPFLLPDVKGKGNLVSLDDYKGVRGILILFICNHCPYVKLVQKELVALAQDYAVKGIAMVAINSNDVKTFPEDSPDKMHKEAEELGYPFPYLFDESQEVAKAYQAACTPDIYLFDAYKKLVYHGQLDDARPGNDGPVTGADLRKAMDALLAGRPVLAEQKPCMGCNIKWKPGNEPDYFKP